MIPDKRISPRIEIIILEILSKKPKLSVQKLYGLYSQKVESPITTPGFYKVINRLREQRVLIKESGLLSIDAGWIQALDRFNTQVQTTYQHPAINSDILLEPGESTTFTFQTLKEMDDFWNHALITIVEQYISEKKEFAEYAYTDHYWMQLTTNLQEEEILRLYKEHNIEAYHVVTSQTWLGQLLKKQYVSDTYHVEFKKFPQIERGRYIIVIGDYIFEHHLPVYLFGLIDEMFSNVESLAEYDSAELRSLTKQPCKAQLTICHDPKRAKQLSTRIKNQF